MSGSTVAIAVTLATALVAVTCNPSASQQSSHAGPVAPAHTVAPLDALAQAGVSGQSAAPPLPSTLPSALPAAATADPAPPGGPGHELARFYDALRGLEQHTRKEHVRVAWLGDSHGASDLWSGPVRAALQSRFGDGGPGFIHLGYRAYRHEGVRLEVKGKWATTPRGPSTAVRTGDGVFGLGGVLLAGTAESPRASLTITDAQLPSPLTWDICYKLTSPKDEFELSLTGQPDRRIGAAAGEAPGALRHLEIQSAGASPTLKTMPLGGQPRFCGVTVETDPRTHPGVVLDTLGINGARLTTPLAWSEAEWVAELRRRPPALVILEYGTNESGDHVIKTESYVENLKRVMARVHAAAPEADCVVLAPTDRVDTPERTPLVVEALRAAARASSCMYWDTYATMGGKGSIVAWRIESPPRAAPDGVHLRARGYHELGDKLVADMMAGYRP